MIKNNQEWWLSQQLLHSLKDSNLSGAQVEKILRTALKSKAFDIALASTSEIILRNLSIKRAKNGNYLALQSLSQIGLLAYNPNRPSLIAELLKKMCNENTSKIDWITFFGSNHENAEMKSFRAAGKITNDPSSFVQLLDVFNDLLLTALYQHDSSLGTYQTGNIGGIITSARLQTAYPAVYSYCCHVHDKRLECDQSHPIIKNSTRQTQPIKYQDLSRIKRLQKLAINELKRTILTQFQL